MARHKRHETRTPPQNDIEHIKTLYDALTTTTENTPIEAPIAPNDNVIIDRMPRDASDIQADNKEQEATANYPVYQASSVARRFALILSVFVAWSLWNYIIKINNDSEATNIRIALDKQVVTQQALNLRQKALEDKERALLSRQAELNEKEQRLGRGSAAPSSGASAEARSQLRTDEALAAVRTKEAQLGIKANNLDAKEVQLLQRERALQVREAALGTDRSNFSVEQEKLTRSRTELDQARQQLIADRTKLEAEKSKISTAPDSARMTLELGTQGYLPSGNQRFSVVSLDSSGAWWTSPRSDTFESARESAIRQCLTGSQRGGCQSVNISGRCFAIARSPTGSWSFGTGPTRNTAGTVAVQQCNANYGNCRTTRADAFCANE